MLDSHHVSGGWPEPDEWPRDDAPLCASYLRGVPEEWARWPVAIDVGFTLTPVTCVYQALFDEYKVRCTQDAVRTVLDRRNDEIFVMYTFRLRDMELPYRWFAIWPIARRGAPGPRVGSNGNWIFARFVPRGVFAYRPGRGEPSCPGLEEGTVFRIANDPVDLYGRRTVRTLGVGGRTRKEAIENWLRTARAIRDCRAAPAHRRPVSGKGRPKA